MSDRWLNAHVEIVVPLLVSPDAPDAEKERAVGRVMKRVSLDGALVGSRRAWWEEARKGVAVKDRDPEAAFERAVAAYKAVAGRCSRQAMRDAVRALEGRDS